MDRSACQECDHPRCAHKEATLGCTATESVETPHGFTCTFPCPCLGFAADTRPTIRYVERVAS